MVAGRFPTGVKAETISSPARLIIPETGSEIGFNV